MRRNLLSVLALAALASTAALPASAIELEANSLTLSATVNNQTTFQQVSFLEAFSEVPIVMGVLGDGGGDPASYRIRNVTTTGFEVAIVESPGEDGQHAAEPFSYVAATKGVATLASGLVIEVGSIDTNTTVQSAAVFGSAGGFDSVALNGPFSGAPAIVTGIQTMNNESTTDPPPGGASTPWLTTSIDSDSISSTGFDVALERAETDDGSTVDLDETIGYIAFSQGVGVIGNTAYDAQITPDVIDGWDDGKGANVAFNQTFSSAPIVIASMARRDGADGGWIRTGDVSASQVQLIVDEDQFNDGERGHTAEAAGMLAFGEAFHAHIPEPASAGLMLLAAGGLLARRRRAC